MFNLTTNTHYWRWTLQRSVSPDRRKYEFNMCYFWSVHFSLETCDLCSAKYIIYHQSSPADETGILGQPRGGGGGDLIGSLSASTCVKHKFLLTEKWLQELMVVCSSIKIDRDLDAITSNGATLNQSIRATRTIDWTLAAHMQSYAPRQWNIQYW